MVMLLLQVRVLSMNLLNSKILWTTELEESFI